MTRNQLDQILTEALERDPELKSRRFSSAKDFGGAIVDCAKTFRKLNSAQARQLAGYAEFMY